MIFIMMTNMIVGHNFLWNPLTYLSKALGNQLSNFNDLGDSGAADLVMPPEPQFTLVLMVEMSSVFISLVFMS